LLCGDDDFKSAAPNFKGKGLLDMEALTLDDVINARIDRVNTSFIGLKLPPALVQEIDIQALREDRSRSALVRKAVREYLAMNKAA
jgi:Ribbon-helix-helix protein, copG family